MTRHNLNTLKALCLAGLLSGTLLTTGCGQENPVSESDIDVLEARINNLETQGKEIESLKEQTDRLETKVDDWSPVVSTVRKSVYAVLYAVFYSEDDVEIYFTGTAFSIDDKTLVTNGHIIDGLNDLDKIIDSTNREFGTDFFAEWIVVKDMTTTLDYGANYFSIDSSFQHPDWQRGNLDSPDVGALFVAEGRLPYSLPLASVNQVRQLSVGQPVATMGYPGELQSSSIEDLYPISTFKNGTVSALRPSFRGRSYTSNDTYIVQHNLDLSGGTSGSPIFDLNGRVVAVNNASIDFSFITEDEVNRVSQAALGFGIRSDKVHDLFAMLGKPAARPARTTLAPRLDGRDFASLNRSDASDAIAERLRAQTAER